MPSAAVASRTSEMECPFAAIPFARLSVARQSIGLAVIAMCAVPLFAACDLRAIDGASHHSSDRTLGPLVRSLEGVAPSTLHSRIRLSIHGRTPPCARQPGILYKDLLCTPDADSSGQPVVMEAPSAELLGRAAAISVAVSSNPTADAHQAAALVDIWGAEPAGKSLERSISMLDMAANINPASASIFSDLAAAHLAQAALWRDARELLTALDASSRALQVDSLHAAALSNHLLALQQLGLVHLAELAAHRLLKVDSTSLWATDAKSWLANRQRLATELTLTDTADAAQLRAFAKRLPERALSLAWERLLPEWGAALLKGDTVGASSALSLATVVGETLALRGENSTSHAVRAIADADSRIRQQLAKGHIYFGESQRLRAASQYQAADSVLSLWADPDHVSPALSLWSRYARASNWLSLRRAEDAARGLSALLSEVGTTDHAALRGRILWVSSLIALRSGQNALGLQSVRDARRIYERLGFTEFAAWTTGIEGEVAVQAADNATGLNALVLALDGFRTAPQSTGRHNVLFVLAAAAARSGSPYAALAIQDEDAAVSGQSLSPISRAEVQLSRARILELTNVSQALTHSVHTADQVIASIPDSGMRAQLHHELGVIKGRSFLATNASLAYTVLDSSVQALTTTRNPEKLLPALLGRAYASASLHRDADADRDLHTALGMYLAKADNMRGPTASGAEQLAAESQRDAWIQLARPVFDTLIARQLRRGGPDAAAASLSLIERWRAGLSPQFSEGSAWASRRHLRLPGANCTIVIASVGDQLVTWTVSGSAVRSHSLPIRKDSIERLIERTRLSLERNDRTTSLAMLSRLYEMLIRPVEPALGDTGSIVTFVLDQSVANVPLAGLYDSRRRAHLIERYDIRVTSHTPFSSHAPTTSRPARRNAPALLLIESPDYDRSVYPALLPLPGASREVRTVASQYGKARILRGAEADSGTVSRSLSEATVLHYAGHAVFDESQPLRSSLAMMPRGLTATAISRLPLKQVELVVLSACETGRSAARHGLGLGELSSAFLTAGARGVIASLWRTGDAETARLMVTFHRHFSRTGDAARALRLAQMEQLREAPNAWAAFRYVGQ